MSQQHRTIFAAFAIASSIIGGDTNLKAEDVGPNSEGRDHASYDGVMIYRDGGDRIAHIYLCDDDGEALAWMVDCSDIGTGETNPQPMTLEALNSIRAWVEG